MDNAVFGELASIIELTYENSGQPMHVSGCFCLNEICVVRLKRKESARIRITSALMELT